MIPFQSNANVFPRWKWNWFPAWIKDDPNILLFFKLYILVPELWPSFASLSEFILASCLSITFRSSDTVSFFFWGGKLFLYLISLINESKLLRHVYICVKVMTLPFWMLAFKSFYSSPARTQILQSLSFTKWKLLSCVQLFVNPWTIACQAPLSMEFSWQENWSGWPFPSPGCQASVCSLVLCLVTTKIWSDRH